MVASLFLLLGCATEDPMKKVNALIAEGKVAQAKVEFQKVVDAEQDSNLERKFVIFCFEHKQYRDFTRLVQSYLSRYPDDTELKNLQYEYYAILARDAEKQKNYSLALEYIVQKLLNAEFADSAKWEARQTSILTKWYDAQKEANDEEGMMSALTSMRNLGFVNLAKDLDSERFTSLEQRNAIPATEPEPEPEPEPE